MVGVDNNFIQAYLELGVPSVAVVVVIVVLVKMFYLLMKNCKTAFLSSKVIFVAVLLWCCFSLISMLIVVSCE